MLLILNQVSILCITFLKTSKLDAQTTGGVVRVGQTPPPSPPGGTCQRGEIFTNLRGVYRPPDEIFLVTQNVGEKKISKKGRRVKNPKVTKKGKGKRRYSDFPPGRHFVYNYTLLCL